MELREITGDNYQRILNLSTGKGQEKFVTANLYSLAHAWVFQKTARPYALYEGEEPVGFIMLDWRPEEKTAEIWRFMIDHRYQGKGHGRRAMELALEKIRQARLFDRAQLYCVPGNETARALYHSLGFQETGNTLDGEIQMELILE